MLKIFKQLLNIKLDFPIKLFFKDLFQYIKSSEYRHSRKWFIKWNKIYKPILNWDNNLQEIIVKSELRIDIIITCLQKDLDTLQYTVSYARKNILHPIDIIYIISPESDLIKSFCMEHNCTFINENTILGFGKEKINYVVNGIDRSGWLFQQMLKLSGNKISTNSHFLILDADTIFIRPRKFESEGKIILDFSDEYHLPYYKTFETLTHIKHKYPVSFVSHFMLFEAKYLVELKNVIEKNSAKNWSQAIFDQIDQTENSFFSEFETYANFVLEKYSNNFIVEYGFNKSYKKNELAGIDQIVRTEKQNTCKTISFHTYN